MALQATSILLGKSVAAAGTKDEGEGERTRACVSRISFEVGEERNVLATTVRL